MTPDRLTELEYSSLHGYYGLSREEEEECFAALRDLLARLRSAEAWADKADEERRILANRLNTAESATRDAEAEVKRLRRGLMGAAVFLKPPGERERALLAEVERLKAEASAATNARCDPFAHCSAHCP